MLENNHDLTGRHVEPDPEVSMTNTTMIARPRYGPQLGRDGPIPGQYVRSVQMAIEIAWKLDKDPRFLEVFRNTVAKLSGRTLSLRRLRHRAE
jgi:hypothetical protein